MEQTKFQFDLPAYSRQDLLALNRLCVKKGRFARWGVPLLRGVSCVVGAFCLLTGAILIYGSTVGPKHEWPLAVILILLGLLELYLGLCYFQRRARFSKRLLLKSEGVSVTFTDEGILEESVLGRASYCYASFTDAYDYRGRWFLFLDQKHAAIFPHALLTGGEPAAFEAFLSQKLGKPVIHVKSGKRDM